MVKIVRGFRDNLLLIVAIAFMLLSIIIVAYTYILLSDLKWSPSNIFSYPAASGPLGDVVNGITAPILMLSMAVLTFLAFYVQYTFNVKQLEFVKEQQFSSSFFELLKMFIASTETYEITYEDSDTKMYNGHGNHVQDGTYKGDGYFKVLRLILWDKVDQYIHTSGTIDKIPNNEIEKIWEELYATHEGTLGYYFRNLYNLMKFINMNIPNRIVRDKYYDIVRSKLSEHELFIINYNLNYGRYSDKFLTLLKNEQYPLLKHIPNDKLVENYDYTKYLTMVKATKPIY